MYVLIPAEPIVIATVSKVARMIPTTKMKKILCDVYLIQQGNLKAFQAYKLVTIL